MAGSSPGHGALPRMSQRSVTAVTETPTTLGLAMTETLRIHPHPVDDPEAATSWRLPFVEVTIPVHNEEQTLDASVRALALYLAARFPFPYRITIVDNASSDHTPEIACRLATELDHVTSIRLDKKGRGRALRTAWSVSDADILCYMDVDLSTDLGALLPLVAPLASGHSDVAIGSRLARGARIQRGPKRELVSRAYNLILKAALGSRFSDAQCGFKAIRRDVARALVPAVRDEGWFFDTELLVLAERNGLRIHEVPVDWVEDSDSRVAIMRTALDDLKGVARMLTTRARGEAPLSIAGRVGAGPSFERQVGVFATIGVVSTIAYLSLYTLLRSAVSPLSANALALLTTAVLNTAANRRFTFQRRGRHQVLRHHLGGVAIFGLGLLITSATLAALQALIAEPTRVEELVSLVAANGLATMSRFVLLRAWVFPGAARHPREDQA
jgi:putative flippase GtrA